MKFQKFGDSQLQVSQLCVGTWQMGGDWGSDYDAAIRAVRAAFDEGVNFFDTAYAYGRGGAERGLARGLGDIIKTARDELVIATKGGLEFRPSPPKPGAGDQRESWTIYRNSEPSFLRETLEGSLRNLGVDYVDIYFIHWPDTTVPLDETAGVLAGFVAEGLVRFAGVSNFSVPQMDEAASGGKISAAQVPYSLLNRRSETEIIPYCAEHGIGIMGWSALAHGVLTGAFGQGSSLPPDDWRSQSAMFQGDGFGAVIDVVHELSAIANDHMLELPQLALAWMLANPARVVPVIGAQIPEHVMSSVKAVDVVLPDSELRRMEEVAMQIPPFDVAGGGELLARS
jgi:aryl-alcohol dehydrogenase-like predicted oxidoreductase